MIVRVMVTHTPTNSVVMVRIYFYVLVSLLEEKNEKNCAVSKRIRISAVDTTAETNPRLQSHFDTGRSHFLMYCLNKSQGRNLEMVE